MNITGSGVPLLINCQWWAKPSVIAPPPKPPTESMLVGTEVHKAIEDTLNSSAVRLTSADGLELFGNWSAWWPTSPLSAETWKPEAAYAYDPIKDRARAIETKNRQYVVEPGEIAGTIDAVALNDEYAIIVDWKTGNDFGHFVADAEDNWQLKLYALAVSRAHRVDSVQVWIVRITPQGVTTTAHTLDSLELDAVAQQIRSLVQAAPTAQPAPGVHCRRCKVVAVCPATLDATNTLAPREPVEIAITNPEQATAALVRLRQVQAACEQVEMMLKTWADANGGIQLPNGKKWVRTEQQRESINLSGAEGNLAMHVLDTEGLAEAIETKHTTTKAAIERVLKARGQKGKELRASLDRIMGEMRSAGAVRSATVDAWREVE